MQTSVRKFDSAYKGGSSLNIGETPPMRRFVWTGIRWTPLMLESRLFWLLAAAFVAWLASFPFHRFDPAREWAIRGKQKPSPAAMPATEDQIATPQKAEHFPAHLSPLVRRDNTGRTSSNPFLRLVVVELRLMLQGQRWWWYIVAAGLSIACLASPLSASRSGVLLAAWIWPILIWSQMGCREARFNTQPILSPANAALAASFPLSGPQGW